MKISNQAKDLIEKYIEYIETEDYADLYDLIWADEECTNFGIVGEITAILENINLNPLQDLNYIPMGYYSGASKTDFNIPKNIKEINNYAFESASLKSINIPFNVKYIGEGAFAYCEDLRLVQIDNPDIQIQYDTFDHCYIDKIIYAGSRSDWEGFEFSDRAKFHVVACIDGDIIYD